MVRMLELEKMERLSKEENVPKGPVAATSNEVSHKLSYVTGNCVVFCLPELKRLITYVGNSELIRKAGGAVKTGVGGES